MGKKVTLQDIAGAVGVTPSTVQRALSGNPGVSEEKRRTIREAAQRMGYQGNVMAKLLQKQGLSLAVVLPEPTYYSQRLWDGVERCLAENSGFNITCHRYAYPRSPEDLSAALDKVWNECSTNIDGVLTMGEADPAIGTQCRRFQEHQIPVVWVGTDGDPESRLCCCRGVGSLAGATAAELLLLCAAPDRKMKVLLTGDFSISDQYADMEGLERVLLGGGGICELIKISGKMSDEQMKALLCDRLLSERNVTAIFSTSARNTVTMCKAVDETGFAGQVKLIGSDLFPQSRELLLRGKLHAVIDKRPSLQAYNAAQILINYILMDVKPEPTVYCAPMVITRSSVEYISSP